MSRVINYARQVFGRLTVIEPLYDRGGRFSSIWICKCSCGNETRVDINNVKRGRTKSCGCIHKEAVTKHGMSRTVEHAAWRAMLDRCYREQNREYHRYGGRGITVCDEWKEFEAFYRDMGDRPSPDHSLDREDNDKGYYKENCRWVTLDVQLRNMSTNVVYERNGQRKILTDWCNELGLNYNTVVSRLRRGWSFERAIS